MSHPAPATENEFEGRDAQGLVPATDKTPSEAAEMQKYMKMLFGVVPVIGQGLAWGTYFAMAYGGGQKAAYDAKFAFAHQHQLGYVGLAVGCLSVARKLLVVSANGARAPARVDRPDQHIYKVMAKDGPLKDAPCVLMASTGPAGRFNRAQRAVFNMDESLPLTLANTLLATAVFGPVATVLSAVGAFGRARFGWGYKESVKGRFSGFMLSVLAENWTEGLAVVSTIKALLQPWIPF